MHRERQLDAERVHGPVHMAFPEVPVMAILKEFREMAGPRGRKAHRPAPIPTYDYEKHRSGTVKLDLE